MFRAIGLRSSPFSSAWTGAPSRTLLSRPAEPLLRNVAAQHRAQLHILRNITRQSSASHRVGVTFARIQRRGFRFSPWRRNTTQGGTQEKLTLSQRLKRLSKEYGWSAVGVYLALSVLDFPFCFLLVRTLGTERIGKIEHYVVSTVKQFIPESWRETGYEYWQSIKGKEVEALGNDNLSDGVEMASWGIEEAQERNKEEASLGTQLALAYAIHKSFIFLRVPLTAAITPKIVKVLRSWGWNIGKRASR